MTKEFDQYIPVIRDQRGLNVFSENHRKEMVRVFGEKRINHDIVNGANFDRAKRYLDGPVKQLVEQVIGLIVWYPAGKIATGLMEDGIVKIDKPKGHYVLEVGIPGVSGKRILEKKIRTYKRGADERGNGAFEGVAYLGKDYSNGRVIDNWFPKLLRKTGLDELPQARAIALGKMSLVGIRAYTNQEIKDQGIMWSLVDNPGMRNSAEVKWIVKNHYVFLRTQVLKPAVFSPLACLVESGYLSRLYGDIMYIFLASPALDMEIFIKALANREKSAIRNGLDHQTKPGV